MHLGIIYKNYGNVLEGYPKYNTSVGVLMKVMVINV